MVSLDLLDDKTKERIISTWKTMSESDKGHFINQAALAMSVWGSDEKGRRLVVEVIRQMMSNGTQTLADFGLYVENALGAKEATGITEKVRRAATIIEGYRIKNALSSEPHKEIGI